MDRPFLCSKCGNWYTPLKLAEGDACIDCAGDSHARHPKTNQFDCHYGQIASHFAEVKMMGYLQQVQASITLSKVMTDRIKGAETAEQVLEHLKAAEKTFALAEQVSGQMPETLRWAGVMEMPGKKGSDNNERFKSIEALTDLVKDNRRPPEDLKNLERSVKICGEIAVEIPGLLAEARMGIAQTRKVAENWNSPVAPLYVKETKTKEKVAA